MANKRKKQHYVPQFYLKNFANDKTQFNIFNFNTKKFINNISYKTQCYEDYIYGNDEKWEISLSEMEGIWSAIIRRIINESDYYPNIQEINSLKEFTLFQKTRTTSKIQEIKDLSWDMMSVALEMKFGKTPIEIEKTLKEDFIKNKTNNVSNMCLEIAKESKKNIEDLDFMIINYIGRKELITSDNPIVNYNRYSTYDTGFLNGGILLFFPISHKKLLVFYDKKMYPNNKKIVYKNNDTEVKWLNYFQVAQAETLIIFRDSDMQNNINNYISDCKKYREGYMYSRQSQALGPQKNKMVMHSPPYHTIDYNFSFCRLNKKAIKISKYDRTIKDWFPRKYDEKFAIRFDVRENLLPQLHKNFSNKEKRKQIKIVNNFIEDYWNNNL